MERFQHLTLAVDSLDGSPPVGGNSKFKSTKPDCQTTRDALYNDEEFLHCPILNQTHCFSNLAIEESLPYPHSLLERVDEDGDVLEVHPAAELVEVEGDEGQRGVVVRHGVGEVRVRYHLKERDWDDTFEW